VSTEQHAILRKGLWIRVRKMKERLKSLRFLS